MAVGRIYRTVIIAAAVVAVLAGYAGARFAIGRRERPEMTSRLMEAINFTAPNDLVQIYPKGERGHGLAMNNLVTYHYEFDEVEQLEKRYQGISREKFLRGVFARAVKGRESASDNEKWLAVIDYFGRAMRHPPVEQPMNRDGSMITDPLILLLLQEGRCGHQAGVIVDLALANHYEARLLQLAAHLVAEVKWGGTWHWVDADAGIPIDILRSRFPELPSVEELDRNPSVLDSFPARNWQTGDSFRRTLDGVIVPPDNFYGAELTTSSEYFGKQIFSGVFWGRNASPAVITYEYKKGSISDWETRRDWGWNDLRTETVPISTVPVTYIPLRLQISGPQTVSEDRGRAVVPVRWVAPGRPVCQPEKVWLQSRNCRIVFEKLGYEVRVSRATRGWDYDFRDYEFMPKSGKGDVLVTRQVRKFDEMTYGIDLQVKDISDLFIEVVPIALDDTTSAEFRWPSNELAVQVMLHHNPTPGK